ncbi:MAG: ESPR-type extended signal peptide-containing protein [Variovorax sp.]
MNKSHRSAWNESLGAWVAASETTKPRRVKSGRCALALTAVTLVVASYAGGAAAQALGGANVTNTSGTAISPTEMDCRTGQGFPIPSDLSTPAQAGLSSIAVGCGARAPATGLTGGNVAIGLRALTSDSFLQTAIGSASSVLAPGGTAIGASASATSSGATAIGIGATAHTDSAAINGQVFGVRSVALGTQTFVGNTGADAVAIGFAARTNTSVGGVAIGSQSRATANDTVALGRGATAANVGAVSLGAGSTTSASAAVTDGTVTSTGGGNYSYGGFAGAGNVAGVVSFGNATTGATRQLKNLAPGAITATSTDGVNGGQLYAVSRGLNDRIDTIGAAPGGGGGPVVVPPVAPVANSAIAINPVTYVAPSATGQDTTAVGSGSMATGTNSVSLGGNSFDDGRANVVSVGSAGNERQITNVAPGVQGTDAVNVNQLNATGSRISAVAEQLNRDTKMLSGGIAASAALAVVTPVEPGRYHVSGAVAGYNGEAGVGFNILKRSADGARTLHAGVGWGSGGSKAIVRVGFGFTFD